LFFPDFYFDLWLIAERVSDVDWWWGGRRKESEERGDDWLWNWKLELTALKTDSQI
jgi:hypothetical protein